MDHRMFITIYIMAYYHRSPDYQAPVVVKPSIRIQDPLCNLQLYGFLW